MDNFVVYIYFVKVSSSETNTQGTISPIGKINWVKLDLRGSKIHMYQIILDEKTISLK